MRTSAAFDLARCSWRFVRWPFPDPGSAPPRPPCVDAAEQGDRSTALRLLSKGGQSQHTRPPTGRRRSCGRRRTATSSWCGRWCAPGADVRLKNQFGTTALTEAAIVGSAPILDVLLKAGADPNARNPEGETPIMAAARSGKVEAARVLVEAGADVNAKEEFGGQSALMWAAAQSQAEMVKFLASKRRRRECARRHPQLGTQGHHRAAPEGHEPGRLHAAPLRGARGLHRVREAPDGRRRRSRASRIRTW